MGVRVSGASCFLNVVIAVLLSTEYASSQSLKASLNPGCSNCSEEINVLTVSYQGPHISVHYVISLLGKSGVPSVFLSASEVNSTLKFNWTSIKKHDSSQPAMFLGNGSFYGLLFTHLYRYEDQLDTADVSTYADSLSRILADQCFWLIDSWDSKPDPLFGLLTVALKCNDTSQGKILGNKGEIVMQFTFSESVQIPKSAPYTLLIGGLAVRIKFVLKRLFISKHRKGTRWAIGLTLVSNDTVAPDIPLSNSTSDSIDDEASPGTYKGVTIFLGNSSYATWKAVCYVSGSSTELKTSRATRVSSQLLVDMDTQKMIQKKSFLPFIYGTNLPILRLVNISFGDPGDGFYSASKYIHWSLDLGLGTPPESHLSVLVWVIIFTTIAVLALAIGLFIFVALWRFCLQRPTFDGYERALLTDSVNVQATA